MMEQILIFIFSFQREVEEFLCVLKASKGSPVDLNPILAVSISNVICDIIMSTRFSHNDSRFRRLMDLIDEGFKLFGSIDAVNFIPVLRYLPGIQKTKEKIAKVRIVFKIFRIIFYVIRFYIL